MFIDCPQCRARYRFQESLQGKQVRCKKCDHSFLFNAENTSEESGPSVSRPSATMTGSAAEPELAGGASKPRAAASADAAPAISPPAQTISPPAQTISPPAQTISPPAQAISPPAQVSRRGKAAPQAANPTTREPALKPAVLQPVNRTTAVRDLMERWNELGDSEKSSILMRSFSGQWQPVRTSLTYRLGLFAATMFMLLVPALYLGCIGLLGYAIYLHATMNVGIMVAAPGGRGTIVAFVIYLAPIVLGTILIFFLFKPFLARSGSTVRTRSLTPDGEPLLFRHVAKICEEVGSPMPKRIDVFNEVNASASFRNGFWSMLRGKDLVLSIGMPLVQGLSLQELTGVLAHEFGHFSQGAGMRLATLLRSVSQWLRRAVYERDVWDEWLEEASVSIDLRVGWIFFLSRLAIWFSRKLLWLFLMLGYALTGYILKQMEFDADRYEAAMVGRVSFEETSRKLRHLSFGYQEAMGTLGKIAQEQKRIDNFAMLMQAHTDNMEPMVKQGLASSFESEKSAWYHSHPCDRDRVAAVATFSELGRFRSNLPARALFRHYDAICRGVTEDFYRVALGFKSKKLKVVPAQSVVDEETFQNQAWLSLNRFFLETASPLRSFPLSNYQLAVAESLDKGRLVLQKSRDQLLDLRPHYVALIENQEWVERKRILRQTYQSLSRKMSQVDKSIAAIEPLDRSGHINQADPEKAKRFVKAMMIRLHTACSLLNTTEVAGAIERSERMREQVGKILPALRVLDDRLSQIVELSNQFDYFFQFLQTLQQRSGDQSPLVMELLRLSNEMVETMRSFRRDTKECPYPFDHARKHMTVGRFLVPEVLDHEDLGQVFGAVGDFLNQYYQLRGRCLSYLVVAAQAVENSLELPVLALPAVNDSPVPR